MNKVIKCCGFCKHISNLSNDSMRYEPNVMGGCLLDGHFVTTDEAGCKKWKKWEEFDKYECYNGKN